VEQPVKEGAVCEGGGGPKSEASQSVGRGCGDSLAAVLWGGYGGHGESLGAGDLPGLGDANIDDGCEIFEHYICGLGFGLK